MAALALLFFAWPLRRAMWPIEIDSNEPWNAYWAIAIRDGTPLYPPRDALIANNYPPLSFLLLGTLARLGIDPLFAGRALSLAATLVAAAGVAISARALGAGRIAAWLAGFWFLATLSRFYDSYVGMNDPHLPGLAIMIAALAWLLTVERRGGASWPAFVLMAIAGFYKHSLLATPLAAFLWLLTVDRRAALRGALAGAMAGIVLIGIALSLFGPDFIAQLTAPRLTTLSRRLGSLGRLQWLAPGFIIAAAFAWLERKRPEGRFVALYLAAALAVHLWQQMGGGVADNSQFELLAATAIGIALAFHRAAIHPLPRLSVGGTQVLIVAVLLLRLLASQRGEPYLIVASETFRRTIAETAALSEAEARRVAAMTGPVDCSIEFVCWRAGKPFRLDEFNMRQRVETGRATQDEISAAVDAAGIRLVTIDPRASMRALRDAADLSRQMR